MLLFSIVTKLFTVFLLTTQPGLTRSEFIGNTLILFIFLLSNWTGQINVRYFFISNLLYDNREDTSIFVSDSVSDSQWIFSSDILESQRKMLTDPEKILMTLSVSYRCIILCRIIYFWWFFEILIMVHASWIHNSMDANYGNYTCKHAVNDAPFKLWHVT